MVSVKGSMKTVNVIEKQKGIYGSASECPLRI